MKKILFGCIAFLFTLLGVSNCGRWDPGTTTTTTALSGLIPKVTYVFPLSGATDIPINSKLVAAFSQSMDSSTINTSTFIVKQGSTKITGTVSYSGLNAIFKPASNFSLSTVYTVTITKGAMTPGGRALEQDYSWTFTSGTSADTAPPTVLSTNPSDTATGLCLQKSVNATFSKGMDPISITSTTFTLTGPGSTQVKGTTTYDASTHIATFTSTSSLAASTTFTAKVLAGANGVKDLAENALAVSKVWTFSTGTQACSLVAPVALGAAVTFGTAGGGAGMTNQGLLTVVNGDIATTGASTTVTGFHDKSGANSYTETTLNKGNVTGKIYTAGPPPSGGDGTEGNASTFNTATAALAAAQNLWANTLSPAGLPGGTDPGSGQLGGLTLAPGVYKAAGGSFLLTGSDLTLDGQGDANAIWVFQADSSLTVGAAGAPRSIILINGANAKNVFWRVGAAATINGAGGGTMVGTIIAHAGVTFSTAGVATITTLNGRALGLTASVTMVNTVINVPAP